MLTSEEKCLVATCIVGGAAVIVGGVAIGMSVHNSRRINGVDDKVSELYRAQGSPINICNMPPAGGIAGMPIAQPAPAAAPAPAAPAAPAATAIDPATMQAIINQAVAAAMAQQQPQNQQNP